MTAEIPNYRVLLLPVAVRALVAMGQVERAEALLPLEAYVRTERHALSYLTARAVIAEARGDVGGAAGMFAEAAERWERYGFTLETGLTLLDLARCRFALERDAEATTTFERGREVLAQLGVQVPAGAARSNDSPGRAKDTLVARRYGGHASRGTARLMDRDRLRDGPCDRRTRGHHRGRRRRATCHGP